ncbi:MAG: hypothetical protein ACI4D8_06835 [Wujia sp.]
MNYKKVCVIGADPRMNYVAQRFLTQGFKVYSQLQTDEAYDFVVIPPNPDSELVLRIANYYRCKKIYGGLLDQDNIGYLKKMGIEYSNYLDYEAVVSKNAVYTAMGIASFAEEKGAILKESSCLVTGFGYCGKAIANELMKAGARVDIIVRNPKLRVEIEALNYGYLNFSSTWEINASKYSYVFNTVPAPVLNKGILESLSDNVMIFDIASRPGGTDFNYCRENNIEAYLILGIPGMYYPREAGFIIADAIIKDVE